MTENQETTGVADTQETTGVADTQEVVAVEKKPGIGKLAEEAILAGKTNDEALAAVKEVHPDANTSLATISWYRNNLRKHGHDVPTARDLNKANKPEVDPSAVQPKKSRGKKAKTTEAENTEVAATEAEHADPLA